MNASGFRLIALAADDVRVGRPCQRAGGRNHVACPGKAAFEFFFRVELAAGVVGRTQSRPAHRSLVYCPACARDSAKRHAVTLCANFDQELESQ